MTKILEDLQAEDGGVEVLETLQRLLAVTNLDQLLLSNGEL